MQAAEPGLVDEIDVIVAYALPDRQWLLPVRLPRASTVADALRQSGIAALLPGFDPGGCAVGVFGRVVDRDHPLRDGDRIELYRPLECDPKEIRRQRAEAARPAPRRPSKN